MNENPTFIEVSLRLGLGNDSWRNYKALGIWERNDEGGDNWVEVYLPGHRPMWAEAYGAQLNQSPDGLDQTMVVLPPDRARYIGKF